MAVDAARFFVTGAAAERSAVAGDVSGSLRSLGRRSPGIVHDAIRQWKGR
jgi:hypothetical protein